MEVIRNADADRNALTIGMNRRRHHVRARRRPAHHVEVKRAAAERKELAARERLHEGDDVDVRLGKGLNPHAIPAEALVAVGDLEHVARLKS